MKLSGSHRVFGIRHHGPGSAQQLQKALCEYAPTQILIEGPPEASPLLDWLADEGLQPPVALLLWAKTAPEEAVFFPFAEFSPEWQAFQFALSEGTPTEFMDLPQGHWFHAANGALRTPPQEATDPMHQAAELMGYSSPSAWWNDAVESTKVKDTFSFFDAILSLMQTLREQQPNSTENALREAAMRQSIRKARKSDTGERVAVVCGAWHAPALLDLSDAKADREALKPLRKRAVVAAWVPWTHERLSFRSGYGAGVDAPGWYALRWQTKEEASSHWFTKASRLLREANFNTSPAQSTDALALAQQLAVLRGKPSPDLPEMHEAAEAVLTQGKDVKKLLHEKLNMGQVVGKVPAHAPSPPLRAAVLRDFKRLRLPQPEKAENLVLDLRKPKHLEKSQFLFRLSLLEVQYAVWKKEEKGQGSFREVWRVRWQPELEVQLITAGRYGQNLHKAAQNKLLESLRKEESTEALLHLLEQAILADLTLATEKSLQKLAHSLSHSPPDWELARWVVQLGLLWQHGQARPIPRDTLKKLLSEIGLRALWHFAPSVQKLSEELTEEALGALLGLSDTLEKIEVIPQEEIALLWERLHSLPHTPALLRGRAAREVSAAADFPLPLGIPPKETAAWLAGYFAGQPQSLRFMPEAQQQMDAWLLELDEENFKEVLPALRKTFAGSSPQERSELLTQVLTLHTSKTERKKVQQLDSERIKKVKGILDFLLREGEGLF